jgi:hypothetical protein
MTLMGRNPLKRLVSRYEIPGTYFVQWDIQPDRLLRNGKWTSSVLKDVSIEGALIEADESGDPKDIGVVVTIKISGVVGNAKIRHRTRGSGGNWLYGVQLKGGPTFMKILNDLVASRRQDNAELKRMWEAKRSPGTGVS